MRNKWYKNLKMLINLSSNMTNDFWEMVDENWTRLFEEIDEIEVVEENGKISIDHFFQLVYKFIIWHE